MNRKQMIGTGIIGGGDAPAVPFSQDFSANNSLSGWSLQSGNAAVPSTALVITPTQGVNLVDAAISSGDGIGNATHGGTNTLVSSGGEIVATYVDHATGITTLLRNSGDLSSDLTAGAWYRTEIKAKVNSGSVSIRVLDGSVAFDRTVTNTTIANYIANFIARSATAGFVIVFNMGAGEVATLDDYVLYALSNTIVTRQAQVNCTVGAGLTIAERGTTAGVIINADKAADQTPTKYLAAVLQRGNTDSSSGVSLLKLVNGTLTTVIAATTVTYVAGATLQIQQITDTTYKVLYNNVQVGTDQTISDANINANTYAGLIGLYGGNSVNRFFLVSNPLYRIALLGDSITAPATGANLWGDLFCRDYGNGANLKINHAIGGMRIITFPGERVDMDIQVVNAASDDADLIISAIGSNDDDDAAITAEYEENLIELQTSNPRARIFGMGILEKLSASAAWRDANNVRIETACQNAGVPYWDTTGWINTATDLQDDVHPNDLGRAKIAAQILARVA